MTPIFQKIFVFNIGFFMSIMLRQEKKKTTNLILTTFLNRDFQTKTQKFDTHAYESCDSGRIWGDVGVLLSLPQNIHIHFGTSGKGPHVEPGGDKGGEDYTDPGTQ